MGVTVRSASPADAERLLEIYAYYVEQTAISFELETPTAEEFRRRIERTLRTYPYLVLEEDGRARGYAYAGPFKERAAYRFSCEVSIYLARDARGLGYGRKLYEGLEKALAARGIRNLYACIADPMEEDETLTRDSERFHRHMGYETVGRFHGCGRKFGRWYNMIWMEKLLDAREPSGESGGELSFRTLRETPERMNEAAAWFHSKWHVPEEAYLACMGDYLAGRTEYGWYLCLEGERIVAGLGVIQNDFHERKDLFPNICAVYTEEAWRCRGIAGRLLSMAVEDLRSKGISPVYLLTDHTGFYERYGWEFFCMARGDGEDEPSRLYIHR